MLASLAAFTVLIGLTATSDSANQMIVGGPLTGIGASGVVPLALAMIGLLLEENRVALRIELDHTLSLGVLNGVGRDDGSISGLGGDCCAGELDGARRGGDL
jgi:MFS family permease